MHIEKRWLITGVSSGIGEALAKAALKRGDIVFGSAREQDAIAAFEALEPGRAFGLQLDVTNPKNVKAAVDETLERGPLDVVVANAGQSIFGAFEETSIEEAKALLDVNLFAAWDLAQAVLPHFRGRGKGQLVHVSSGCGLNGTPGLSAYSASKFALEGFSEALALEVAQFGVDLLIVEPGAVSSRFISKGTTETTKRLPEYSFLSGQGKAALDGYYASCAMEPGKVADAIMAAIEDPAHPRRVLVGDDVRNPVRTKAEHLLALA